MSGIQHIIKTGSLLLALLLVAGGAFAQSGAQAVYYVCAESGFKLQGPAGYDEYLWKEDNTLISGADSSSIGIQAMGAGAVGNSSLTRVFHLQVRNSGQCWSEEGDYTVHVLPKLDVAATGYAPPYCENLPHAITLTAKINGGLGTSQLTLPPGVDVKYDWLVSQGFSTPPPVGNASIIGPTHNVSADVVTPQTTLVDNTYILKVSYTYPPTVNTVTDVVGDCGGAYVQVVHADPEPEIPVIQVQQL